MTKIFVVVAYRWGWLNNDWYHVCAKADENEAVDDAEAECGSRGGKYGVAVYDAESWEMVNYFPSIYREKKPYANWRIMAAERVGLHVLTATETGESLQPSDDDETSLEFKEAPLPDWLREDAKHETEIAKVFCPENACTK